MRSQIGCLDMLSCLAEMHSRERKSNTLLSSFLGASSLFLANDVTNVAAVWTLPAYFYISRVHTARLTLVNCDDAFLYEELNVK